MNPGPMPPPTPAQAAVLIVFTAAILTMLAAWVWALLRLARGRSVLPRSPLPVVPWGVGAVLLVLALYLGLQIALGAFLPRPSPPEAAGPQPPRDASTELAAIALVGIVNVLTFLLVPRLLQNVSGATRADLGLTAHDRPRNLVRGIVAALLLYPACILIMVPLTRIWKPERHPVERVLSADARPASIALTVLVATVLAPLTEELLFRGVLLPWLAQVFSSRKRPDPLLEELAELPSIPDTEISPAAWNAPPSPSTNRSWLAANLLTSAIFALMHAPQWPAPVSLFILALGLGSLYQRTGSLWAPIALHMTFNSISTFAWLLAHGSGLVPAAP